MSNLRVQQQLMNAYSPYVYSQTWEVAFVRVSTSRSIWAQRYIVHTADVGHPFRPVPQHHEWARRVNVARLKPMRKGECLWLRIDYRHSRFHSVQDGPGYLGLFRFRERRKAWFGCAKSLSSLSMMKLSMCAIVCLARLQLRTRLNRARDSARGHFLLELRQSSFNKEIVKKNLVSLPLQLDRIGEVSILGASDELIWKNMKDVFLAGELVLFSLHRCRDFSPLII